MRVSRIQKYICSIALSLLMVLFLPQAVQAAVSSFALQEPSGGKAGERVSVTVSAVENTGFQSMMLGVEYDPNVVAYKGADWKTDIGKDEQGNLLSDEYGANGKVVSISLADKKGITQEGDLVTLHFDVKADYKTSPFALVFRSGTNLKGNVALGKVQGSAKEDSSKDKEQLENNKKPETVAPETKPQKQPEKPKTEKEDIKNGETTYDENYKTGVFDSMPVLMVTCVVLAAAAALFGLCSYGMRKHAKREIQNTIGSRRD